MALLRSSVAGRTTEHYTPIAKDDKIAKRLSPDGEPLCRANTVIRVGQRLSICGTLSLFLSTRWSETIPAETIPGGNNSRVESAEIRRPTLQNVPVGWGRARRVFSLHVQCKRHSVGPRLCPETSP